LSGKFKNYFIRNIFINSVRLTYLNMVIDFSFLIYKFKLSKIQTGSSQLLIQPVGTAVAIVCVRVIVSSFNAQHDYIIQGRQELSMESVVEN